MCWITYNDLDVKVADEDIEVFKVVKIIPCDGFMELKPWFFTAQETYGAVSRNGKVYIIGDGLHTMSRNLFFENGKGNSTYCNEAFHSYSKDFFDVTVNDRYINLYAKGTIHCIDFYKSKTSLVMNCIIPKGTKYAVNEIGEVISEAIKVVRFSKIIVS